MKTDKTAVTGIILETRKTKAISAATELLKTKADELHPVKLRITYNKDRKYYTLKGLDKKSLYMSQSDFDKYLTAAKFKSLKTHLGQIEERAMQVINGMSVFSFEAFESDYFSNPKDKNDLFSVMAATAKQLRTEGRISTAITFEFGLKSLKEFSGKEKLPFERVTVKFLKEYEKWMLTPRVIE